MSLMTFSSHIDGRNARVTLYPDRIEWQKPGRSWVGPIIVACLTAAISLIFYRGTRGSTDMMLLKAVQGVTTTPSGMQTLVAVSGSGQSLAFRCSKPEADAFKARVLSIVAG